MEGEKQLLSTGNFNIPSLCASQGLPSQPSPSTIHVGEDGRKKYTGEPDKMNEGRENRRPSPPPPPPRDTLKRFFFVRDSSRHRGITSFPLAGSPARDVLLVPANLILKPRIRVAEYDEKKRKGKERRKSANFFRTGVGRREAIALYEAYAR